MQDLRNRVIRLAHRRPELRGHLVPILRRHAADYNEYVERKKKDGEKPLSRDDWDARVNGPSEKPKEESGAKDSEAPKESLRSRLTGMFSKIKGAAKSVVDSVKKAPENVQKFVVDSAFRKKAISDMVKGVKKTPEKLAKHVLKQAKHELKELKHAAKAGRKLFKKPPGPFTKEDKAALYAAGAYVAKSIVATMPPHGAAIMAAGAIGASFGMHVGIKSIHHVMDKGFTHFEWAESVFHVLHHVVASKQAAEGDDDKAEAEFIEGLTRVVLDMMDQGISDEDMEKIMADVEVPKDEDNA